MSDLERIKRNADEAGSEAALMHVQILATVALAEQTAALVEQQRIGNLIAVTRTGWAWDNVEELEDAKAKIREAVGLPKVSGLRERIITELVADWKHVTAATDPVALEGNIRAIVFSS